jgi:hypothetical protein
MDRAFLESLSTGGHGRCSPIIAGDGADSSDQNKVGRHPVGTGCFPFLLEVLPFTMTGPVSSKHWALRELEPLERPLGLLQDGRVAEISQRGTQRLA